MEFNAWENDFSENSLICLSSELLEEIRSLDTTENGVLGLVGKIENKVNEISQRELVSGALRIVSSIHPTFKQFVEEITNSAESPKKKNWKFTTKKKAIAELKVCLQNLANSIFEGCRDKPLIFVIDELDRCRPSYAVELLEVAKHIFAVDHIVFVLAINRTQLAHSIRAYYGHDFDGDGYLKRFFDIDFRLPEPDRSKYIDALLKETKTIENFERLKPSNDGVREFSSARRILKILFSDVKISHRTIAQTIHRLGLIYFSLRDGTSPFIISTTLAMALRTRNPDLYYKFSKGLISDRDVVENLFGKFEERFQIYSKSDLELESLSEVECLIN